MGRNESKQTTNYKRLKMLSDTKFLKKFLNDFP